MKVKVYSLKPYFNIDGGFVDIPNQPSFDPKHPRTYPGNQVKIVAVMTANEASQKYGKRELCFGSEILYAPNGEGGVIILELTGKTSRDVLSEL